MFKLTLTQGHLLKKAIALMEAMASDAILNLSPNHLTLKAADSFFQFSNLIISLRIRSSNFDYFRCDKNSNVGINLFALNRFLKFARNEDIITIHGDDSDDFIHLVLDNARIRQTGYFKMMTIRVECLHLVNIDISQYEYDVVVGIPSEEFRRIFKQPVPLSITDNQVKFHAEYEEIVLNKEDGECVIGGVSAGGSIHLSFDSFILNYLDFFLDASLMSNAVWILLSDMSPSLLNCPVGGLGNIMVYFM